MRNKLIQALACGLLIAASLTPGASAGGGAPDYREVAAKGGGGVKDCETTGTCQEEPEDGNPGRCLGEDLGLCYVCYDFHGAPAADIPDPVDSIVKSVSSVEFDSDTGQFRFNGYG